MLVCIHMLCPIPRARHHASRVTCELPPKPIEIMRERNTRPKMMSRGLAIFRALQGSIFPWLPEVCGPFPSTGDGGRVPAERDEAKVDQEREAAAPYQIEELVEDEEDALRE